MKLLLKNNPYQYEIERIITLFFPYEKIETLIDESLNDYNIFIELNEYKIYFDVILNNCHIERTETISVNIKFQIGKVLYSILSELTGQTLPWGILTGIRPSKIFTKEVCSVGINRAKEKFENEYLVKKEKIDLLSDIYDVQKVYLNKNYKNAVSIFCFIPYCPSRCSYCSFVSEYCNSEKSIKEIPIFCEKLISEIKKIGEIKSRLGLNTETVYIGGGTPTILSCEQLEKILFTISEKFAPKGEFTVEAGRADTITKEKLDVFKKYGVSRISINPQSFEANVLTEVRRPYDINKFLEIYEYAKALSLEINMDFIAGLPKDTEIGFINSIKKAIELNPDNITVHTLALKRASSIESTEYENKTFNISVSLDKAYKLLYNAGYHPYYLYRQSRTLKGYENTGWAKSGKDCVYNIVMMEELHSVLSAGAGSVTRLLNPETSEIKRIYNPKYPDRYISSFDEVLKAKEEIFKFYSEKDV